MYDPLDDPSKVNRKSKLDLYLETSDFLPILNYVKQFYVQYYWGEDDFNHEVLIKLDLSDPCGFCDLNYRDTIKFTRLDNDIEIIGDVLRRVIRGFLIARKD